VKKLLRSRYARVRRLVRACLAQARAGGFDGHFLDLRSQLGCALVRLDDLTRKFVDSEEVVDAVIRARTAVLGLNDQLEAMALAPYPADHF